MQRSTESTSKGKPVVKFKGSAGCFVHPQNFFALLHPTNHPDFDNVSNQKTVRTSRVISVVLDGETVVELETENTKYIIDKES
jgi:hypothetical protein